jgi:hypothetical protein
MAFLQYNHRGSMHKVDRADPYREMERQRMFQQQSSAKDINA